MDKRSWSFRVVVRYALFQIPGYILLILIIVITRQLIYIPIWVIVCIITIWFAKDLLIFPSVRRAYERNVDGKAQPIIGMKGTVEEKLDPSGYVKVHGELWQAEFIKGIPPMNKGEEIQVQGIRGLTLFVRPVKKAN